mmetsp:Transcript_19508/g.42445  ORF Transcript_19508/g.42445 Transcript_19508/m.42445 type:complete len:206 (+) Transcript_19508:1853-2470(+)
MAQVSAIQTYSFSIIQYSNFVPNALFISETWPSMSKCLLYEVLERPTVASWDNKQRLASVTIIESDFTLFFIFCFGFFKELCFCPVSSVLGVMSIEVADLIRFGTINAILEILLDGSCRCTVRLWGHYCFLAHHARLCVLLSAYPQELLDLLSQVQSQGRGGGLAIVGVLALWRNAKGPHRRLAVRVCTGITNANKRLNRRRGDD